MRDEVAIAAEALAEAMTEVAYAALTKTGFRPSDSLREKLYEEIRASITLG